MGMSKLLTLAYPNLGFILEKSPIAIVEALSICRLK